MPDEPRTATSLWATTGEDWVDPLAGLEIPDDLEISKEEVAEYLARRAEPAQKRGRRSVRRRYKRF